ncbi:MAG: PGF-pre-PGF domain-containing protein [Candidatus Nanoarchaeia archaeon]
MGKKSIQISIISLVILTLAIASASAMITSARLVDVNGDTLNLNYDTQTKSYADGSLENPNIFVEICAEDLNSELLGKYAGIFYKIGDLQIPLHILPINMLGKKVPRPRPRGLGAEIKGPLGECLVRDIDLSYLRARFPGIPAIAIGDSPEDLSTIYQLNLTSGYLKGNYTLIYSKLQNKIKAKIISAKDHNGNAINYNGPYILIGLFNSADNLEDVKRTKVNEEVELSWSGDEGFYFIVNGFKIRQEDISRCGNGICEPPMETSANCPQDCKVAPTGAVFGYSPPFECKWLSTYDGEAVPEKPISLFYSHDCTLLRNVQINISSPVINARILTIGNETNIPTKTPYGIVFGYFSFEHNIPKEKIARIIIQFKVPIQNLRSKNLSLGDVRLERYETLAGAWVELPTKFVSEDAQYYYFESTSESLSTFAIVAYPPAVVYTPPPQPKPSEITPPKVEEVKYLPILPVLIFAFTLIILLIISLTYHALRLRTPSPKLEKQIPPKEIPKIEDVSQKIIELKEKLQTISGVEDLQIKKPLNTIAKSKTEEKVLKLSKNLKKKEIAGKKALSEVEKKLDSKNQKGFKRI